MAFRKLGELVEPVWQQQPGESPIAYAHFRRFLEQPAGDRSLARLAQELCRAEHTVAEAARNLRWAERARAWDAQRSVEREEQLGQARTTAAHDLVGWIRASVASHRSSGTVLTPGDIANVADAVVQLTRPVARRE